MPTIVTAGEITASSTLYKLSQAWNDATTTERTQAVELVEGVWQTRNWRMGQNPFCLLYTSPSPRD